MAYKISDLILNRVNRDLLLPSIQREFVWTLRSKKIERLFDSIMQGYPIGMILTWEISKRPEEELDLDVYQFVREYDEDNPHNEKGSVNGYSKIFLILDGQQRLSALHIGLRGSYNFTYYGVKRHRKLYLNLAGGSEEDLENVYGMKYDFQFLESPTQEDGTCWFEVGKVLDYHDKNSEDIKEEYDSYIREQLDNKNEIITAKKTLGILHNKLCDTPTIKEENVHTDDDEKVLNIFVRTNDGGVKLEKADLLLSYMESNRKYFKPKGARQEVHQFVDEINKEKLNRPDYGFTKDDILKSCLVLSDLEVQYKLGNFNSDNLKVISDDWTSIKKYLTLTTELIGKFGFSSNNIRSQNAIIPIAYYLKHHNLGRSFIESDGKDNRELKEEIIVWFAKVQLTGSFSGSSDTTLRTVRKNIEEGKNFKEIDLGYRLTFEKLENRVKNEGYNSRYSHLMLMLITSSKYWDNCQQDHIYPQSKFEESVYEKMGLNDKQVEYYERNKDTLANLQLLTPSVNIVKRDDDVPDWTNEQNQEFLKGNLIPLNIDHSFENFDSFITKRRHLILKELSKLLGFEKEFAEYHNSKELHSIKLDS